MSSSYFYASDGASQLASSRKAFPLRSYSINLDAGVMRYNTVVIYVDAQRYTVNVVSLQETKIKIGLFESVCTLAEFQKLRKCFFFCYSYIK